MKNETLECDERGVIQPCPHCGTGNRITYSRLGQQGRCGSCQKELPTICQPVDINSALSFAALTAASPLPVVIDFWAPWCGPCRTMAPEFGKAAKLAMGEAIFVKINTEELGSVAEQFRIRGIPAFALLKNGKLIKQTTGSQMAAQLLAWMRG